MFITWLLLRNNPHKCQLVYSVRMYSLSGTSRLIFCVMYVLWKQFFCTDWHQVFLAWSCIGSKNHLLGFKWWSILAWVALVVEQHYYSITLSMPNSRCWWESVIENSELRIMIIYRMPSVNYHSSSNLNPNPLLLLQLLILMNRFFTPWTPAELLELPF